MDGQLQIFLILTVGLMQYVSVSQSLQCLDANNNAVDWYAVYKSPKVYDQKGWIFKEGLAYFYLDLHTPQWSLARNAINDTDTAVHNTLEQIYTAKTSSIMYIMYNDESPPVPGVSNRGGHTKGVLGFDQDRGFWLIHSCPKWPPKKKDGYGWKSRDYGQSMLCITFPYKQLDDIATQLLYNEPHVYDSNLPMKFATDFPQLSNVIKGKNPPGPPWWRVVSLTSDGGQMFASFAKAGAFGADLYDALVAPHLKSNLLVETWLRSDGIELDSNCTARYQVLRVNSINLPGGVAFNETKDHSKWSVSYSGDRLKTGLNATLSWVCVGDINRMKSQFHRGGGTTCFQNSGVWKAYSSSVGDVEKCL